MNIEQLLRFAVTQKASDIHLHAGLPAALRINGLLRSVDGPAVPADALRDFLTTTAPASHRGDPEAIFRGGRAYAFGVEGLARFRARPSQHQGEPGLSLHVVPLGVPTDQTHTLPPAIRDIALSRNGLTLIAGPLGSGRTTTMAAMVEQVRTQVACKLVVVEDPVEYLYPASGKALLLQREVGRDASSFEAAIEQALQEDADVIVAGALGDGRAARPIIQALESGRQVIVVVRATGAVQALDRFLALLAPDEQRSALGLLAQSLEAVVAQRQATLRDGTRRPIFEILRGGPIAGRSLSEGRLADLARYMTGRQAGMQTFDQGLLDLYQADKISGTEAMRLATNVEGVARDIQALRAKRSGEAA
jgi:twitching motility protein PilT